MKANPILDIPAMGESHADAWMQWYDELLSNFGAKEANAIFLKAWHIRGTGSTWFGGADTLALRQKLKKNGLVIDESATDKLVDAGSGIGNFFGDIFTVGKWAGIGLVVILVGGIGLVVYHVAISPNSTIKAVRG